MAEQFVFIDEKELGRSVEEVVRKLRKAHGRYMADEMIKQVFKDNAKPFKESMSSLAPMQRGTTKTKSNISISKRNGVRQRSSSIKFKGGNLKKSIDIFPSKDKDDLSVHIGPRTKKVKSGMRSAFYGYFQNFGTKRGVQAKHFSEKAFQQNKTAVGQAILKDLESRVGKMNRELNGAGT